MDILQQTKQLCQLYNIRPVRSRGQNFLIDENIYKKIIETAGLKPDDIVLEVGAGFGFLTEMLARKARKVAAVEVDEKLAEVLKIRLEKEGIENVEIISEDILKFSIFNFQFSNNFQCKNFKFKIVANLPYNITSRFLRKFLAEVENKPSEMILMLQKEVAERICAQPGQMSLLAVSAQFYATPKIIARVPASAFWPRPKVESAIIHLSCLRHPPLIRGGNIKGGVDEEKFFRLVKIGFSAKRKQLQGNLAKGLKIKAEIVKEILADCKLKETIRAQELSLENWYKLYVVLDRRNVL